MTTPVASLVSRRSRAGALPSLNQGKRETARSLLTPFFNHSHPSRSVSGLLYMQ